MVVDDLPTRKLVALLQEGGGGKWQQRTSPPQSTGRWRKSFSLLPRTISCSVEGGLREVVGVVMGGMVRYGGWCEKKDGMEGRKECIGLVNGDSVGHMHTYHCWCVGNDPGGMDKKGGYRERMDWMGTYMAGEC